MANQRLKLLTPDEQPDAGDFGEFDDGTGADAGADGANSNSNDIGIVGGTDNDGQNGSGADASTVFGTGDGSSNGDDGFSRNPDGSFRFNKDGSRRRKRGRKAGGTNSGGGERAANSGAKSSFSVGGIEALLFSIHTMGAAALKAPELTLSEGEAQQMAIAITNVAKHYPTTIVDPKIVDWGNLLMCLGMAYGPRVYMIRERVKQERQDQRENAEARGLPRPTQGVDVDFNNIQPGPRI